MKEEIARIYDEVTQRAFKTELYDIRTYIDSKIMTEQKRIDEITSNLETKINVEIK